MALDNKERIYHLFEVNDYKGGELTCHANLTEKQLYRCLADYADSLIDDFCWDENENKSSEEIKAYINTDDFKVAFQDQFGPYAGSKYVIEIFKSGELLVPYYYDFDKVRETLLTYDYE